MADYKDKRDEKTERRAVQKCDPEDAANNFGGNHSLSTYSVPEANSSKVGAHASFLNPTYIS